MKITPRICHDDHVQIRRRLEALLFRDGVMADYVKRPKYKHESGIILSALFASRLNSLHSYFSFFKRMYRVIIFVH